MRGGQALIITEPWGLNETRLSPTVYFPGHVHVAINVGGGWDKQSHRLNSGRLRQTKMSIKPGSLLSVLSFVTKGGIHQINVPPENLFTPKLGSLHKYQIDFKRVPLEPSFSAFHVLLLSIENDASGCGCSVALSINGITT